MITIVDYVEGFLSYIQDQDEHVNPGRALAFCAACRQPDTATTRPKFHQYARQLCPTCAVAYETFLARVGAVLVVESVTPLDPAQQRFLERQTFQCWSTLDRGYHATQ